MLETYLKQITYYKVNVNGLKLRSEVTAVHFGRSYRRNFRYGLTVTSGIVYGCTV